MVHLYVQPSVCMYINLTICSTVFVCLSICLYVNLYLSAFFCPSVCSSTCLFVHPCVCMLIWFTLSMLSTLPSITIKLFHLHTIFWIILSGPCDNLSARDLPVARGSLVPENHRGEQVQIRPDRDHRAGGGWLLLSLAAPEGVSSRSWVTEKQGSQQSEAHCVLTIWHK